jgi:uncharacterized protein
MISRNLKPYLLRISGLFPVVSITGPRQAGKTTLIKEAFPNHHYLNLEDPSLRELALTDPRSFLKNGVDNLIIDEAQYVPHLFSYIQVMADEKKRNGQFILSGSQNFLLMEKITQSLAGRVAILHLLPLSIAEQSESIRHKTWEYVVFRGGYPKPVSENIHPADFYPFYIQSYLERDIRQLVNVTDLERFRTFLSLCAGRIGQQVNFSAFGNEIGIDAKTVTRWLSVLETSFITFRLPQFHKNFGKRLIKSPKLYFHDTGLACYLLGIKKEQDLHAHFAKGSLFESFIISELLKNKFNAGEQSALYYLRDNTGHEVDLVSESSNRIHAVEVKSSSTINTDFFKNLEWLSKIAGNTILDKYIIYGGADNYTRLDTRIQSWRTLPTL